MAGCAASSSASMPGMRIHIPILSLVLLAGLAAGVQAAPAKAPSRAKPAAKASAWKPVVPFLEDDFGRALALAKERKLPVFIEGWAPW